MWTFLYHPPIKFKQKHCILSPDPSGGSSLAWAAHCSLQAACLLAMACSLWSNNSRKVLCGLNCPEGQAGHLSPVCQIQPWPPAGDICIWVWCVPIREDGPMEGLHPASQKGRSYLLLTTWFAWPQPKHDSCWGGGGGEWQGREAVSDIPSFQERLAPSLVPDGY